MNLSSGRPPEAQSLVARVVLERHSFGSRWEMVVISIGGDGPWCLVVDRGQAESTGGCSPGTAGREFGLCCSSFIWAKRR